MTVHCAIACNVSSPMCNTVDSSITFYNFSLAFLLLKSDFARVSLFGDISEIRRADRTLKEE
jgi:hypothetical protein